METLIRHAEETHETLAAYLALARACPEQLRGQAADEHRWAVETFLEAAGWHLAAVTAVIVPAVRVRLPDGHDRARRFIQQSRRVELALTQAKAKVHGTSYVARRPWESVWTDVAREYEAAWRLERELLETLVEVHREGDPNWHAHLDEAELRAVTRPYPRLTRQGERSHVFRTLALQRPRQRREPPY